MQHAAGFLNFSPCHARALLCFATDMRGLSAEDTGSFGNLVLQPAALAL